MVIEVGPMNIRAIDDPGPPSPIGAAALRGIDDPVVLWSDGDTEVRPVDVDGLLRAALTAAAGDSHGEVTLVHPSGWPQHRVIRLLAAAPPTAVAITRSAWIRQGVDAEVVIEVTDTVAVCTADALQVRSHPDPDWVIRAVGVAAEVILDDPRGRASDIRRALQANGTAVHRVALDDALRAPAETRPASRRGPAAAAAVLVAALTVTGLVVAGPRDHRPATAAEQSVTLVEGRLAVRVPAGWSVHRVTDGPGSARVEVRSPTDPAAVLHLTTSYTPQATLTATAAVLNRAVAMLPRGVFSAVSAAELAGRPVLSYLENRPGRSIRWAVLLDGDTRIAIGCQRATGHDDGTSAGPDDGTRAACEQAVSSAREVTGTGSAPVPSN